MIHVIAHIRAHSGRRAELLDEFRKVIPLVRSEDGCLEYGPAVDALSGAAAQHPLGEDVFAVVEKWESLDHLQAHLSSPHMARYRETVKDLVAGVTLYVLEPA